MPGRGDGKRGVQIRRSYFGRIAAGFIVLSWLLCLPAGVHAAIYINNPSITLSWTANPEPDVQGYEIFRATLLDGLYERANEEIIPQALEPSWTDTDISEGVSYYYKLCAVDTSGNNSIFSGATDAIIIDLTNPTIIASPPEGTYSEAISISLISSEPATILYTLDGTAPISDFENYTGPVPMNTDGVLRYFAIDRATNQSQVMTSQYVIGGASGEVSIISGPDGTPNPVESGGEVACSVLGEDSLGHALSYEWRSSSGTFSDATIRNPVWHAPANTSGTMQNHEISIFVTCSEGQWAGASYIQGVLPSTNDSPVARAGDDRLVSASAPVALNGCGSYDPDAGPSPLSYAWEQTGGESVELSGRDTCNPTFIPPDNGDALTFELTVSDGMLSATDTVTITVDAQPPELLIEDLGPYPDQGLDGNAGASAFGCIRARVLDDTGIDIDPATCETLIEVYSISESGERLEPIEGAMVFEETAPGLIWMMFVPDYATTYPSGLPYGLNIETTITACDLAENSMEPYRYHFKVETTAPTLPAQTRAEDLHPNQTGDTLSVTLAEGEMAGTRMEYSDAVPVQPFFGPVNEFSAMPQADSTSILLNLQPTAVFSTPVKIFIELPAVEDLSAYEIYHYDPNPAVGWRKATIGDGWLEYRVNHNTSNPPTIEVWIKHFTGIGLAEATAGAGGSSDGGSCFIATAAYGSYSAHNVLVFRMFRDRYLLANTPGRLFVKTYYRLSPPLANFIAKHEYLRAVVRAWLSPLATASDFALVSPQKAKRICIIACVFLAVLLLLPALFWMRNGRHRKTVQIFFHI